MTDRSTVGPRHPSIQRLRRLSRRRSARSDADAYVIDGPVLVAEALDAELELHEVIAEPRADPGLLERVEAAGVRVHHTGEGVLERVLDVVTPRPVAAVAKRHDVSREEAISLAGSLSLVLVGVSDPGNAGTLLRTAEAVGAGAVLFCDGSVDPFNPKCVRASAGSLFRVTVASGGDAVAVLQGLGDAGVHRIATAVRAATPYTEVDLVRPLALVLGSEAHGLPGDVAAAVDEQVTIEMMGRGESLNVSTAAAVVCFEALRQRRAVERGRG